MFFSYKIFSPDYYLYVCVGETNGLCVRRNIIKKKEGEEQEKVAKMMNTTTTESTKGTGKKGNQLF